MLFNSFAFICLFFPLTWVIYSALRSNGRHRLAILALLAASLIFYVYGERTYWWLIGASILFNFWIGQRIRTSPAGRSRAWLAAGVTGDLLTLVVFKYTNFLAAALAQTGLIGPPQWRIALPIGISFYTFTQIAYLVDVYRNEAKDYDPVSYGLFVTFFPHLIAGPILHHKEMMPQFAAPRIRKWVECLADGIPMFALGLFKKTVLADTAAPIVDTLFSQAHGGATPHLIAAWGGAIAYAVQIYFDFSGYSDMAIGLARMLGIDLPINFNSPYKASSISDFWRRWHITLSRFLRDYLYIPLGGNRRGRARRYVNLFVTMAIGGIWHGAGWTFLLWGALHGLYLVIQNFWTQFSSWRPHRLLAHGLTMVAVIVAWVPFRAPDLTSALAMWRGMIGLGGIAIPSNWPMGVEIARRLGMVSTDLGINGSGTLEIFLMLLACFLLPNSQQIFARGSLGLDSPGYHAKPPEPGPVATRLWRTPLAATAAGLLLGMAIRTIGGYSAFIYFQF